MAKEFTLIDFIEVKGVNETARLCGVSTPTVSKWKALENAPRPLYAMRLIEVSAGILTWESIYKPFATALAENGSQEQLEFDIE